MPASPVRLVLAAVAAAALLLGLGAVAAHGAYVAEGRDPAGDARSPDPGHDIVAVGLGYDRRTGQLAGAIQLRGAPGDGPAFATLVAASSTAQGCAGAAAGFAFDTDDLDATWHRFASPTEITARGRAGKQGYRSALQELTVADRALAGLRPDCVIAALTEPGNPQNVYDSVGPLRLRPLPSLSLRIGGVPEDVRSGRSYKLKVTVANPGDAPTARVRVRLAKVSGVAITPRTATLRPIAAGGRRTTTMTLRFSDRAPTGTDLRVFVEAGRLRLSERTKVFVSKPVRGGGGGGGTDGGRPGVCTRWFPDFSGETGGSLGLVPCQI